MEWRRKSDEQLGGISLEMGFYKETWAKMDHFNDIIETIPSTQMKIGSILLETATIKKVLTDIPRQITESIRNNVTQTMETSTKVLREELNHVSEVLDCTPSNLEKYMQQVNMLKYLRQRDEKINS